jgi:high-affinity iron transporter
VGKDKPFANAYNSHSTTTRRSLMKAKLHALMTVLLLLAPLAAACAPRDAGETDPQAVIHLLDYVAVEYPQFVKDGRVTNSEEYAEQVEFAGQIERAIGNLPAHPKRDAYAKQAAHLLASIQAKADAALVSSEAKQLQRDVVAAYNIEMAPRHAPDMRTAAATYAENCAVCHGVNGNGKGPQSAGLQPAPTDFTDPIRQSARSVYGLYNTITLGVAGTAMPAFAGLTAEQRWQVAFYASRFGSTDAQRARGAEAWERGEARAVFRDLAAVVTSTPAEARQKDETTEAVLAYLRANPAQASPASTSPIAFSIATLEDSFRHYQAGKPEEAYQLAVNAYLEGFELAEAALDNRDHELRTRIEAAMMEYRAALKQTQSSDAVSAKFNSAVRLLSEAQQRLASPTVSPTATFLSSLIIVLREGLEAILVLAAMAAFLIRTGRRDGLPWLHGGWIVALLLGGVTWLVSSKLIAITGAQREVTEGVTALISAGLLLYVGFWLHNKSNAARWSDFIRGQMRTAMQGGTLFGFALVAFFALYREVFETVLFYQALWLESEGSAQTAVIAGFGVGAAVLVVLAWLIARFSVRLPLRLFFGASSVLLAIMAVVFAGQGIAALQSAGKLSANPITFPSVPLLGIYPNLQGLALQLALITVIVVGFLYTRNNGRRAS